MADYGFWDLYNKDGTFSVYENGRPPEVRLEEAQYHDLLATNTNFSSDQISEYISYSKDHALKRTGINRYFKERSPEFHARARALGETLSYVSTKLDDDAEYDRFLDHLRAVLDDPDLLFAGLLHQLGMAEQLVTFYDQLDDLESQFDDPTE